MSKNSDVWLGWSYWAGGPWVGNYMFSVEPANNVDKPQMQVLRDVYKRQAVDDICEFFIKIFESRPESLFDIWRR